MVALRNRRVSLDGRWWRRSAVGGRRQSIPLESARVAPTRRLDSDAATVIVGAGFAGLATALLFARRGWRSVVLERDPLRPRRRAEEMWAAWPRPSTPQARLGYALLPGLRHNLLLHLPEWRERVLALGAVEYEDPGDAAMVDVMSRRTTMEGALRLLAEEEPLVTLRAGLVASGLAVERGIATCRAWSACIPRPANRSRRPASSSPRGATPGSTAGSTRSGCPGPRSEATPPAYSGTRASGRSSSTPARGPRWRCSCASRARSARSRFRRGAPTTRPSASSSASRLAARAPRPAPRVRPRRRLRPARGGGALDRAVAADRRHRSDGPGPQRHRTILP